MITSSERKALIKDVCNAIKEEIADVPLTVADVAKKLDKTPGAIKKMCDRKQLPFRKFGRTIIFSTIELNAFLLEMSQKVN